MVLPIINVLFAGRRDHGLAIVGTVPVTLGLNRITVYMIQGFCPNLSSNNMQHRLWVSA